MTKTDMTNELPFDDSFLSTLSDNPLHEKSNSTEVVVDNDETQQQSMGHIINPQEFRSSLLRIRAELDHLLSRLPTSLTVHQNIPNQIQTGSVVPTASIPLPDEITTLSGEKILEGIFNGEKCIGPDGREYHVPPNYASKSKLVTGDRLKLTITPTGSFIYKQIGPIERQRLLGTLCFEAEHNKWNVDVLGQLYKVLTASISFYKGKPGDEAIILVPQNSPCEWATVDNIISK